MGDWPSEPAHPGVWRPTSHLGGWLLPQTANNPSEQREDKQRHTRVTVRRCLEGPLPAICHLHPQGPCAPLRPRPEEPAPDGGQQTASTDGEHSGRRAPTQHPANTRTQPASGRPQTLKDLTLTSQDCKLPLPGVAIETGYCQRAEKLRPQQKTREKALEGFLFTQKKKSPN